MPAESSSPRPAAGYRILRRAVRVGIRLRHGRPVRLNAESFPSAGPVLAVVSHPAGFLEALLLVAALDRQVHCRIEKHRLHGWGQRLLAWGLGMLTGLPPRGFGRRAGQPAIGGQDEAGAHLARGGVVAVFAVASPFASAASLGLALAAHVGFQIVPIHLFLPVGAAAGDPLLIYFDRPLDPGRFLAAGGASENAGALSMALDEACRRNVFGLQPEEVGYFLADLAEVSKSDLAEGWAARRNWKQQAEGFRISGFVAEWVEQLNFLQPGRLVAMRERLIAYREAQRATALRQLKVETAGKWIHSLGRRAAVWAETVLTFPIALYGLVNHLLPAALLYAAGLGKQPAGGGAGRKTRWLAATLVVLGCYAGQVLLCAQEWGRAAAGYYALTLPVSGLELWRYLWLVRNRTSLLRLRALVARDADRLRRRRKELLREVERARRVQVEALGLAD